MKPILTIVIALITNISIGQDLSGEIDSIYNFKPATLSKEQQDTKLPMLDRFWEKVKNDTSIYLPQLRSALKETGHNPFFYYDGSALLLTISNTATDKQLAVHTITKCDLDDISERIFVGMLNQLAHDGVNVTPAAVKILSDDKFSFFIPQHAMSFNQGYCLTYMLLPQKDNSYVDTLVSMFPRLSTIAKKSVITTLWFGYSCKGDDFLDQLIKDESGNAEVKMYAKKLLGDIKLSRDQKYYLKEIGKEHLHEIRKLSLKRFSDEAIAELDMTTRVLRKEQKCN